MRPNCSAKVKHHLYPQHRISLAMEQTAEYSYQPPANPASGTIYTMAYRVIVWLGPAKNDSKDAVDKDKNKISISTALAISTRAELGTQNVDTTDGSILRSPDATHHSWCHNAADLPYPPERSGNPCVMSLTAPGSNGLSGSCKRLVFPTTGLCFSAEMTSSPITLFRRYYARLHQ